MLKIEVQRSTTLLRNFLIASEILIAELFR